MKLNEFAHPEPILSDAELATIKIGSLVKIQLTDGIGDKFNETIIVEVTGRDEHFIEGKFIKRQLGRFDDKSKEFKSPFALDTFHFIKEAVFAIEND
ncbi:MULTISPECIES: hypothetical protein [Serratia]|uniref:hypothetical protein n=1 Tax=Serratia TaxID=613 RepID=UPI0021AB98AF|nr:hypothetical protein [Serratia marcescens]